MGQGLFPQLPDAQQRHEFYNLPLDDRNFNGTIMEGAFDYDLCPLPQFDRLASATTK